VHASNGGASALHPSNVVVLHGHVSSAPRSRELPSGSTLLQLELTTRADGVTASVPVVWFDPTATVDDGDEIVVVGHVRRRFFQAAGTTQSRTEVVVARVAKANRRRDVERLRTLALEAIGSASG
jgi:single-strand DNA-binding protein